MPPKLEFKVWGLNNYGNVTCCKGKERRGMKLALIGYGNMGKAIEQLVMEQGNHDIVSVSYKEKEDKLDVPGIQKADVAIDFTASDVVLSTITQIAKVGVPMVIGTTGWYGDLAKVESMVKKSGIGLIYGGNFSVGAQVFFRIVDFASSVFNKFSDYDVYGYEIHHSGKKDSPSGTAKKLSDILLKNMKRKKEVQTGRLDRQIKKEEFHFASVRGGSNFGFHEIVFDSPSDEIKLSHSARSRRGFAKGAIMAAEFIRNKKGLYKFDEVFDQLI